MGQALLLLLLRGSAMAIITPMRQASTYHCIFFLYSFCSSPPHIIFSLPVVNFSLHPTFLYLPYSRACSTFLYLPYFSLSTLF